MNLQTLIHSARRRLSIDSMRQLLRLDSERAKLLELPVFALVVPFIGVWLFPHDPFGLNAGFPWAAALPVLFAARYGASWGVGCGLIAAIAMSVPVSAYAGQAVQVTALALGTIVLCVLVGDAASQWRRRAGQSEAENQYLRHRLKEFSNDYHVLKVSHGHLEEHMAGQRLSLRQALQRLRPVLTTDAEGFESGSELMAVFAQFCSVQIAGLYAMNGATTVNPEAVAIHGAMDDLPLMDPLLKMAIKKRELVSVKLESVTTESHKSGLLAVVPIVDSQDRLHGVLAVRDMHFMAFQQDNLNVLALLGGFIGDMLARSRTEGNDSDSWFKAELVTASRFARSHAVQSSLVCMTLPATAENRELTEFVCSNIRSLDSSWYPEAPTDQISVAILLPLMSEQQCDAYQLRLETTIQSAFGRDLQNLLVHHSTMQIGRDDSQAACVDFIYRHIAAANENRADDSASTGLRSVA